MAKAIAGGELYAFQNKNMLTKCSECGKDVSNKAKTCPFCGCPLEVGTTATVVEKTGKQWKGLQVIGGFLCIVGILFAVSGGEGSAGGIILLIGFILFIVASIGAWWYHG